MTDRMERIRDGLESGELVQCEYCGAVTTVESANVEQFPGATLTFCNGCYNE